MSCPKSTPEDNCRESEVISVQVRDRAGNDSVGYSYGSTFPCTHRVDPLKGISSRRIWRETAKAQRRAVKRVSR
jgi:hypothetical protein